MKATFDKEKKEKWSKRAFIFMTGVLAVAGIWAFALPKATESVYEKRELAKLPEFSLGGWFGKTYATGFDAWFSDTFPFRDTFAKTAGKLEDLKGIRLDGVKIYGSGQSQSSVPAPSGSSGSSESSSESSSGSSSPAESSSSGSSSSGSSSLPDVNVGDDQDPNAGYLTGDYIIVGDRGFFPFGGNLNVGYKFADYLSRLAEEVKGKAEVYSIIVPTSVEFYMPAKYGYLTNSQKDNINAIYARMNGVHTIDAYGALQSHTGEYIYLRTDHHWTALGAFYAYEQYCRAAGISAPSIDSWEKRTIKGFLGTIYSGTGNDPVLGANPDYVDYYITGDQSKMTAEFTTTGGTTYPNMNPWYEQADGYGVFIWGDNRLYSCSTGLSTGKNAVLIKESFGNAFAPFLFASYDNVWVIDYRYWDGSLADFVEEHDIDDVIFLNNAFTPNTAYHAERINTITK